MSSPLDDLVGESDNGGWTGLPDSITIPGEASGATPRIYLGSDDPLADAAGLDAAEMFYFNTESAFALGVETFGTHNDGTLYIKGLSNDGPNSPVTFMEYNYGTGYLGGPQYGAITFGDPSIEDIVIQAGGDVDFSNTDQVTFANGGDIDMQNTGAVTIQPQGQIILGGNFPADVIVDGTITEILSNLSYLKGQKGVVTVSFVTLSSTTIAVVFPFPFAVGVTPDVQVNINSGAGPTARWGARAIGISNTGFTLFLFKMEAAAAAATWSNILVNWSALTEG